MTDVKTASCLKIHGSIRHTEGCALPGNIHFCDTHPLVRATHTNARESARLPYLAVRFWCDTCAGMFLTAQGREDYKIK